VTGEPNGMTFRYPPEGFVSDRIAGRPVRCISAAVQVLCHLGYEPKERRTLMTCSHSIGPSASSSQAPIAASSGER
jgi:hypothetical protein